MENSELLERTEEWKCLERKTLRQREMADAFYEKKLMKLIESAYILNNSGKVYEKVEYLIMSVGTSYEPLALNIQLLKPQKILFLYTKATEYIIDKIVKYCKLDNINFDKSEVHETNPLDIYKEIKSVYLKWSKPQKLYIDFTGGTKSMSVAAAMAGALIDVQLVYVGTNNYLVDFRKPNPGSETLFYISNPIEVFGDLEIEKAFALFDKYNYAGARSRLTDLKESVPDPQIRQQLNFVYYLSCTYEHWDALDFPKAYESIKILNKQLMRDSRLNNHYILMDFLDKLLYQESILESLKEIPHIIAEKRNMEILQNKEYIIPLMFSMYINACVREKQEKYDMSTLLLYRLLEMIEQRRLAIYNLYVSKMRYDEIEWDYDKMPELSNVSSETRIKYLSRKITDIKQSLFKNPGNGYLAEQVSLLEGFIILLALKDSIVQSKDGNPVNKLKRIRSMVFLRNNSIFAHGLGPVSKNDFLKFKEFVREMFVEFCLIEEINFEEYIEKVSWVNPLNSKNYTGMEV